MDGQKVFVVKNSLTGAVVVLTAPLDFEKMKPSMSYYVLNVTVGVSIMCLARYMCCVYSTVLQDMGFMLNVLYVALYFLNGHLAKCAVCSILTMN